MMRLRRLNIVDVAKWRFVCRVVLGRISLTSFLYTGRRMVNVCLVGFLFIKFCFSFLSFFQLTRMDTALPLRSLASIRLRKSVDVVVLAMGLYLETGVVQMLSSPVLITEVDVVKITEVEMTSINISLPPQPTSDKKKSVIVMPSVRRISAGKRVGMMGVFGRGRLCEG